MKDLKNKTYKLKVKTAVSKIGESTILLNLHSGSYYELNEVAHLIVDKLDNFISFKELKQIVVENFDIEEHKCDKDILSFLQNLMEEIFLKYYKLIKLMLKKFIISIISLLIIFPTSILYHTTSFESTIKIAKKISTFFLKILKKRFDLVNIFIISRKINRTLGISSCFKICLSQKIIFSIFGYDVKIISGVKKTENHLLDGHALLTYNQKPLLGPNENIDLYIESFTV